MDISIANSLEIKLIIAATLAPFIFRMPTSFFLCLVVKETIPYKPKQAMVRVRENIVNIVPRFLSAS